MEWPREKVLKVFPLVQAVMTEVICLPIVYSWDLGNKDCWTVSLCTWDDPSRLHDSSCTLGGLCRLQPWLCLIAPWLGAFLKRGSSIKAILIALRFRMLLGNLASTEDHVPWTLRDWNTPSRWYGRNDFPIVKPELEIHHARDFLAWLDNSMGW